MAANDESKNLLSFPIHALLRMGLE